MGCVDGRVYLIIVTVIVDPSPDEDTPTDVMIFTVALAAIAMMTTHTKTVMMTTVETHHQWITYAPRPSHGGVDDDGNT